MIAGLWLGKGKKDISNLEVSHCINCLVLVHIPLLNEMYRLICEFLKNKPARLDKFHCVLEVGCEAGRIKRLTGRTVCKL